MPLILPGNVASATAATGFNVDNSCRFQDAKLTLTPGSTTAADAWTFSVWIKRSHIGVTGASDICSGRNDTDGGNHQSSFEFDATDHLYFDVYHGGVIGPKFVTNRVFRDPSAWYHIVLDFDSTTTTNRDAADRMKVWVNGVRETSFSSEVQSGQDQETHFCQQGGCPLAVGAAAAPGRSALFEGYMAELYYIAGVGHAASEFGEFDEDSPTIWKPKDASELTFGTNGFYLDFGDSAALGADVSGNSNDLTESGLAATDQTTDTPTNNFATMNPLRFTNLSATYSEGNCEFVRTGTGGQMNGTQGITKGKWYYECLIDDYWQYIGWSDGNAASLTAACSDAGSHFYGVYANLTNMYKHANGSSSGLTGYTVMASGQYIMIAFDADNGELYYGTDGTWGNSSDPTARTSPALTGIPTTNFMMPSIGQGTGGRSSTIKMNFGGCSAFTVSSANADANGYGAFEYAVPSGYYALCTKNLAEYG